VMNRAKASTAWRHSARPMQSEARRAPRRRVECVRERPGALHGGTAESHSVRGLGSASDALKAEVRERRSDALGGTPSTPRGFSAVYSAAACRAVL
jgi:hypothetical protein